MSDNDYIPVIIAGGGPAGIAAALTLSARNVPHVIVDARELAPDKPGECIPPNAFPLFKKLGLEELLADERHVFYHGNQSVWGNAAIEEKLFLFEKYGKGILLNRNLFEEQLRKLSEKTGSRWLAGYALQSLEREESRLRVVVRSAERSMQLYCSYIIDATGRNASVARKAGGEKEVADQLSALDFKLRLKAPVPLYVHTESFDKGWIYAAPSGKELSVMIFTDPDLLPAKDERERFIAEILDKTILMKQLLQKCETGITGLKVRSANSSSIKRPYGDNWLAVGDAAYSYDPVSSYGITSALAGGYYGAHALADTLLGKEGALEVYHYLLESAFQKYTIQLQNQYSIEKRWPGSPFWARRHKFL